jgi:hypothetical protein
MRRRGARGQGNGMAPVDQEDAGEGGDRAS